MIPAADRKERGSARIEVLLFAAIWIACAWFHPGGGWNQNARFAQVRAIVEQGRLAIDDYLVYRRDHGGSAIAPLERAAIRNGELVLAGARYALSWHAGNGALVAADGREHSGARPLELAAVAASGDLAVAGGHFFPNKAPGTTFAAVPAYLLLFGIEKAFGLDPDDVRTLTMNAWLTTALSVGLLAALAALWLRRIALSLNDDGMVARRAALIVAVTWALGTLSWSYGAMLQEQIPAAAGLAISFGLLLEPRARPAGHRVARRELAAGLAAGCALLASYTAVGPVILLALYAAFRTPARGPALGRFCVGLVPPLALLFAYQAICFGDFLSTAYTHQNPSFAGDSAGALAVFAAPRLDRLALLLVSPYRGLLFASPVLVAAAFGIAALCRRQGRRLEGWLAVAVVVWFLLLNASFNGWHGGWAAGPRYLVPALPFLVPGLAALAARGRRLALALAAISIVIQGLTVAVDPQSPAGTTRFATVPGRTLFLQSPLLDWNLPLFLTRHPSSRLTAVEPAALDFFRGPVSAHPVGSYEGWFGGLFGASAPETRWNSFNAGELFFPASRWSLAPLVALLASLLAAAWRRSGGAPQGSR